MKDSVSANNAFVKSGQNRMASQMGGKPSIPGEAYKFDACMSNDGDHAQSFAKKLTSGIDKAFPVK